MKKGILLLLLISSFYADAQSLKEALYSGKLKNTPGTVIRRGDDLTTKMDTATKVTVDTVAMAKSTVTTPDPTAKKPAPQAETTVAGAVETTTATTVTPSTTASADSSAEAETASPAVEEKPTAKDNNAIVKTYMTSVVNTLKTEVLSSKKIKKESYYVLVSYSVDTEGQMTVTDVFVSPENAFLQQQVKDKLSVDPPKLVPTLSSNGTPRKVNKKYNFTLTKE